MLRDPPVTNATLPVSFFAVEYSFSLVSSDQVSSENPSSHSKARPPAEQSQSAARVRAVRGVAGFSQKSSLAPFILRMARYKSLS
jgi:hypothetical protein